MSDAATLALKALAGGGLVLAFALLSETLEPKRFAGLFSAAPAVAIASLAIVLVSKGAHDARENTIGMIAGAVGMICYAAATVTLLQRTRAAAGTALGMVAWAVPTALIAAFLV